MEDNIPQIKVGILVSYDYQYLKDALPGIYEDADSITLAVDKDGKTWSGNDITIPDSFFDWIKEYDKEHKINIYRDSFYVPNLPPLECDTRERNMLARFMGEGGWHVQVDSDEYFLDFKGFCNYLRSLDINQDTLVFGQWITMFKQNNNDHFLINAKESVPLATNNPKYRIIRVAESGEAVYTAFKVLHQSWARNDDEIKLKLINWGHKNDFDVETYFKFWNLVNKQTFTYFKNFHPFHPEFWPFLEYFEARNIQELITKVSMHIEEEDKKRSLSDRIKLKDFIPPALYKIKAKLTR